MNDCANNSVNSMPLRGGICPANTKDPKVLIPHFLNALREISPEAYRFHLESEVPLMPIEAVEDHDSDWWLSDQPAKVFIELIEILDGETPIGFYFGYHPDNRQWGVWSTIDRDGG